MLQRKEVRQGWPFHVLVRKNLVARYAGQLAQSDGIIFAHYTGLTVPQMQDLPSARAPR